MPAPERLGIPAAELLERARGALDVRPPGENAVILGQQRDVQLRFDVARAVPLQLQVRIPRHRGDRALEEGVRVVQKARMTRIFERGEAPARHRLAVDRQHLHPGLAEIGLQDHSVVARTQNDAVVDRCPPSSPSYSVGIAARLWPCFLAAFSTSAQIATRRPGLTPSQVGNTAPVAETCDLGGGPASPMAQYFMRISTLPQILRRYGTSLPRRILQAWSEGGWSGLRAKARDALGRHRPIAQFYGDWIKLYDTLSEEIARADAGRHGQMGDDAIDHRADAGDRHDDLARTLAAIGSCRAQVYPKWELFISLGAYRHRPLCAKPSWRYQCDETSMRIAVLQIRPA